MSADAIVEVKEVRKIYDGGVEALRDVEPRASPRQAQHAFGPQRVR